MEVTAPAPPPTPPPTPPPGPEAYAAPVPAPAPSVAAEGQPDVGLLLFQAEECLAAGQAERAVVLASRAVKDRPTSLAARALYERARRELLRGRRREVLEGRIRQARSLLEAGDLATAERIVGSALKLVPDHKTALALFGLLKERRRAPGTAEAEAEREIERISLAQAQQALAAARDAFSGGWPRRALTILRRALRRVPDHPDLLALLREVQAAEGDLDLEAARLRAGRGEVRRALELLEAGRLEDSLKVLRAVLHEDPDNARAQAAIQEVRQAWLARSAAPLAMPASPSPPVAVEPSEPPLPAAPTPTPPPTAAAAPPRRPAPPPLAPLRVPPLAQPLPEVRRPRRRATPVIVVVATAATLFGILLLLSGPRGAGRVAALPPPARLPAESPATAATGTVAGPLSALEPELRTAVEQTLADYARALETRDGVMLARIRPDLEPQARGRLLAPFVDALNVAVDLRVIDAAVSEDAALVSVLRTDVIVGGSGVARPPEEEALRFERRGGAWTLSGAARR